MSETELKPRDVRARAQCHNDPSDFSVGTVVPDLTVLLRPRLVLTSLLWQSPRKAGGIVFQEADWKRVFFGETEPRPASGFLRSIALSWAPRLRSMSSFYVTRQPDGGRFRGM